MQAAAVTWLAIVIVLILVVGGPPPVGSVQFMYVVLPSVVYGMIAALGVLILPQVPDVHLPDLSWAPAATAVGQPGKEGTAWTLAARCMRSALRNAGINPEQVDYVNAHGTSTPLGDKAETLAVKTAFGQHAKKLAVSSTKSMTGHLLGAAGGVEAVYTALAILHQVAPPTINYFTPDPDCDLDYVPNTARAMQIDVAMSNSFGFGGTNGTLVMRRLA